MATETIINDYFVTLASSVSSGAGTLLVSTPAPVAGGFRILVGTELMLVNSGGTTPYWSVTRGVESSTAAAHNAGDTVHIVMTAAGMLGIFSNFLTQYQIQSQGLWSSGTTYGQYAIVYWQGSSYISSQSSNSNNQPDTSPSYWNLFLRAPTAKGPWSSVTTYAINDIVSSSGTSYISLVSGNLNNTPASSPTQWSVFSTIANPNAVAQNLNVGVPALSSLTQINISGTGSVVENPGVALTIVETTPPNDAGLYIRAIGRTAPTPPYRVALYLIMDAFQYNYVGFGAGWAQTAVNGGKLEVVTFGDNSYNFEYQTFSAATTRSGDVGITGAMRGNGGGIWIGLRDDNAGNIYWEVSNTGAFWSTIRTNTKTYLGSHYDQTVFYLFCDDNTFGAPKPQIAVSCLCWDNNALSGRVVGLI